MERDKVKIYQDRNKIILDFYNTLNKRGRDIFKECLDEQITAEYPALAEKL